MFTNWDLYLLNSKLIIGFLILTRLSGMFISAPIFKMEGIPILFKVMFMVIFAASITATYWDVQPAIDFDLFYLVLLVFKELLVGIIIGFSANIVFWGVRFAGGMIDYDMGFQAAMVFSMNNNSPSLVGEYFELAAMMVFLGINGHHHLLTGIYASIKIIPLTTFSITNSTITGLATAVTSVFIIGLKIAAPVLAALFLTNLALALLSRMAPQTNVFVMSFQVKIAVGILVLFASVPIMVLVMRSLLEGFENELFKIIMTLNSGRV